MAMSVQEAYNILNKLHGYTGPRTKTAISNFINARDIPIAVKNRGGMVGYQEGGDVPEEKPREYTEEDLAKGQEQLMGDVFTDPSKAIKKPEVEKIDPDATGAEIGDTKGQAKTTADTATTTTVAEEDIEQADEPTATAPKQKLDAEGNPMFDAEGNPMYEGDIVAKKSETKVTEDLKDLDAKTLEKVQKKDAEGNLIFDEDGNPVYERQIEAVTKDTTDVSKLDAAKIEDKDAAQIDELTEETKRKLEEGEKIEGTGVDTKKVEETFGTGEVKAASVKDELATLMDEFDDGQTPAWAAGSMRKAMQTLAARGLGAASLAGQAVIQAAMEAALPIAQIDASNKQEMAVLKAEQRAKFMQQDFDQAFEAKVKNAARISEIADTNFTAEQQIALENAKLAQTTNIANLEAENALVLAEAAATSALELENLSNQMKAKVENARNFLQIDMANLDNEQETSLFKAQKQIDAILSDVASENSALQFNATSRQQAEQFDESLTAQVKQFNTNQKNAIKQFNAGEENAIEQFNTAQQNARDQFNAENDLVIAQANAKWRQDTETINTATENQATFEYAKETNGLTNKAIDTMWQRERDLMSFAFTASEAALDRALKILMGDKTLEGIMKQVDATEGAAKANLFARLFFGEDGIFGE